MRKNYSIQIKMVVPILIVSVIVFGTMTFMMAKQSHDTAQRQAVEKTMALAKSGALDMRLILENCMDVARNLAHLLEVEKKVSRSDRDFVVKFLRDLLEKNKILIGTWTGWEPNAWDNRDAQFVNTKGHDASGRFVPYMNWEGGKPTLTPLLGYTKAGEGDYYLVPQARMKETMIEPYLYPIDGVPVLMTSAVVPISIDNKFVGVAGVDVPLKEIQKKVETIKPYPTSQVFLVTNAGNYVSHPDDKLITKKAIFPFDVVQFEQAIKNGKDLIVSGLDPQDSQEYLYVVSPMSLALTDQSWSLVIRTPMKSVLADVNDMVWTQLGIAGFGILLLFAAVILVVHYISKAVSSLSLKLFKSGEQISTAIQQLSESGQSLSSSTGESASSLEETVASLEQMTSMVKLNSQNAKEAAELSLSSSEVAVKGETEIQELLASMNEISDSSKKIEEIINVIEDIAFQTNILALNASVEAARAGEHGKGFAVVADEVRTLAQKSAVAAKDISSLIKDSVSKIENGAQKSVNSSEMLKNIVASVKKVSDLNNNISAASEEQAMGIDQISKAMNHLDQAVQTNAKSSEEIAGSSNDISHQVQIMKSVVDELNLVVYGSTEKSSH